jgi:hypothetical protein
MKSWAIRVIAFGALAYISYAAYDLHRGGFFNAPDLPDGAYLLSFENGLRAVVLDAQVTDRSRDDAPKFLRRLSSANRDRKYLGVPFEVQPWFKDAWSWCKSPNASEHAELSRMPDDWKASLENARFEAVCRINIDGKEIVRGWIFSVPRV